MNPTNEQELRTPYELARYIVDFEFHSPKARYKSAIELTAHYEQLITAHTNAEIARTLDRIASKKNIYVKHAEYVTELNEPPLVITTDYKYMIDLGAIQAERAKLKEVK